MGKDSGSSPAGNRVSLVCILKYSIACQSEVMVSAYNSRSPSFKDLWGIRSHKFLKSLTVYELHVNVVALLLLQSVV